MSLNSSIKVSIIVPVHNSEKTISRCIESLINQSLKELEIILVNDNSTDMTNLILTKYQQLYSSKIVLLHTNKPKEMIGPGYARNLGIEAAHGEYIGFVDSDDWVDSNLYYSVYNAILKEDADIAIFGVKNECINSICSQTRYQYTYNTINNLFALHMLCHSQNNDCYISPMVCQKLYKKNYIKKNKLHFNTNSFYEDDQFSFCCFLHECKIVLVPETFYHYYQNPNSITHTFSKKHIDTLVDAFVNIRNYLQEFSIYNIYYDDFFSYIDKCIASTLNSLFCAEAKICVQKEYIIYLTKKMNENFTIEEWINYVDTKRIQRFFGIIK